MATPAVTAKLVRGARTLDLNSGRYRLAAGFVPPATQLVPQMAGGTSANRRGGAVRTGLSAINRSLDIPLHIVNCTSPAEVTRALSDLAYFLALAGDESEPLYFYFKPDADVGPAPSWGQSGYYYEIAHGDVPQIAGQSNLQHLRGIGSPGVTVTCQIKPYAQGRWQRLMSATGGVLEDRIGTTDGLSRGLIIPPAASNFFTNPVLSACAGVSASAYAAGWTLAASISACKVTDPALLPGPDFTTAVRLTSRASGSNTWTQAIQVTASGSTHVLSTYARLVSGCPVTATHAQMSYNGSALSGSYFSEGNGNYRLAASLTSAAGSPTVGIAVASGYSLITTGFQLEPNASAFATPLAWGDLVGCAWSSSAHQSTTTRTLGRARLAQADYVRAAQGTIRIVVRLKYANTFGPAMLFWQAGGSADMRAYFETSDDTFRFSDGTNGAASTAQTFSALTTFVLHYTWGTDGLAQYVNGTLNGSNATYTQPALDTYLYLGTDSGTPPGFHNSSTFLDLTVWDVPLSAAEVLADYNDLAALVTDSQRVSAIPWLWTKDGDDVVDNHDDSGEDNFCVVSGVPGSEAADTEYYFQISGDGGTTSAFDDTGGAFWLSLLTANRFLYPDLVPLFVDNDGTPTASTDLGSNVETISVNTTAVNPTDTIVIKNADVLYGKQVYLAARLSDAGSNLTGRGSLKTGSATFSTPYRSMSADATRRWFIFGPLVMPERARVFGDSASIKQIQAFIQLKRSVAGAANVTLDYEALLFEPLVRVKALANSTITLLGINSRLRAKHATIESGEAFSHFCEVTGGEPIDLVPGVINTIFMVRGNDGSANVIADALTFETVHVKPRWGLL